MILITGGLGFLGANLTQRLCAQGERVLATSNRNVHIPDFLQPFAGKNLTVAPLDITSLEKVCAAVKDNKVTGIVHAAVRSEKGGTPLYDAMNANVTGTINVLEAAHRAGVKRVVFVSSEAVYQGMPDTRPFKEEEKLFIASDRYIPGTKKAGEVLCLLYAAQSGMEVISARATRMYGPLYQGVRNLAGHMVDRAARGQPIALGNQDPAEAHDILYAKDAARALALLLQTKTLKHRIRRRDKKIIAESRNAFRRRARAAHVDADADGYPCLRRYLAPDRGDRLRPGIRSRARIRALRQVG